jgi:hypothetical protein
VEVPEVTVQTRGETSKVTHQADDVFLWRYPLVALGCELTLATLAYLSRVAQIWLILAALLLILTVFATMVVTGLGVAALVSGMFKRAAAVLLVPVILISPLILPILPAEYAGLDLIRFSCNKGTYDAVIAKLAPAERVSKVVSFDWGVTGFLLAPTNYSLVYDESGEIALPDEERSRDWRDRVYTQERWDEDHCVTSARHLIGHYYSVTISCSY